MKTVKFVRSLVVEEVPLASYKELRYYTAATPAVPVSADEFLLVPPERAIEEHVVPVQKFCGDRFGAEGVYIAYSHEVETLLGLPFNALCEANCRSESDNAHLHRLLHAYGRASWWRRLKFLFTGSLRSLRGD